MYTCQCHSTSMKVRGQLAEFFSHHVGPGIELRPSRLAARAFTQSHWANPFIFNSE